MKPVFIDGFLFFVGSFFGSVSAGFASDAAYMYVDKYWVFWIRILSAAISTSCISLITFRNQTYAKWLANQPEPPKKNALQPGQAGVAIGSETQK